MGNNEMMLGVDSTLNIVPDHPAASPTCGHRAGIGISQRYLLVFSLHHQGVQTVQALNLLTQRRNLLVEPGDLDFRHRFPLTIGTIKLREIAGYALVNLRQPPNAAARPSAASCADISWRRLRFPPARATRRSPGHQYVCAK